MAGEGQASGKVNARIRVKGACPWVTGCWRSCPTDAPKAVRTQQAAHDALLGTFTRLQGHRANTDCGGIFLAPNSIATLGVFSSRERATRQRHKHHGTGCGTIAAAALDVKRMRA